MAKSCPVTAEVFAAQAKAVEVILNGVPMLAEVKEFSSKSFGWYLNGKTVIQLADGSRIPTQVGITLTAIGSKPSDNPGMPSVAPQASAPAAPLGAPVKAGTAADVKAPAPAPQAPKGQLLPSK